MEPSNLYNHSKRNLVVFAAILALVLFGGVEATDASKVFGFKILPKVLPTVLFFIVIYLLYQFYLARIFQVDEIRIRTRADFALTTIFTSAVLFGYLSFYLLHQIIGLGATTLVIISSLVSALAVGFILTRVSDWTKWRREAINFRKQTIETRLKESGWILNYNPKLPNGIKRISFETDGSIGEGHNSNEFAWRLVDNTLEIINSHGDRQNIFEYDASTDQFKSKRPARKANILGQYIFRENSPGQSR